MDTLTRFLGLTDGLDADSRWSLLLSDLWQPLWPLLALAGALVVYYAWQYRRDARRLSGPRRHGLTLLRVAVVAVVVLALLRPALNLAQVEKRTPVVAVLVDESLSMAYPDA